MRPLIRIPAGFKWCGFVALFAINTTIHAQQLYSDSAVAAMTQQKLCMVLPDTTPIAQNTDALMIGIATLAEPIYPITAYSQCGECFTYHYNSFNFASLLVTPQFFIASGNLCTVVAYIPPTPPVTEFAVGVAASSPVNAKFLQLHLILKAAENLSVQADRSDPEVS